MSEHEGEARPILYVDPERENTTWRGVTGIWVRAQNDGGEWGSYDISELTLDSLLTWLSVAREDGHTNATYVVLAWLKHPPLCRGHMNSPPLTIDERIRLDEHTWARFDGTHIIIETLGVDRVRLTALAYSRIRWMSQLITEAFPERWMIDLDEAMRLDERPPL